MSDVPTPVSEQQKFVDEVLLAQPRGFCAGVDRAIEIVERALEKFGRPIYVRHEIVHNTFVVNDLKGKGAIFIEDLADVPPGATLVFSAHGVSKAVREEAAQRGFSVFDATCPLVTKVHVEVSKLAREGYEFIMIGHKGHPEVEGTMGQLKEGIYLVEDVADVANAHAKNPARLAVVHADHAVGGRRGADPGGRQGALPAGARTQEAGHLLRHAEPPGRRQVHGAQGRHRDRRRQPQPAPTATACANWPNAWARRPTWSTASRISSPSGSRAARAWA